MDASAPVCSVVIPWHRDLDDLARAVASVFEQTFADFELIVVANGVDDATWESVRAFRDDPRYRAMRLPTPGASAARNAGLDAARGGLVFFLDGDDRFHPEKLARFVSYHGEKGFDVALSRGLRKRGKGVDWPFPLETWDGCEPLSEFFFCRGNTASSSAIVVDRRHARDIRFDTPPPYEDPGLLLSADARGLRVAMLPDILYDWFDDRDANRLSRAVDAEARLTWIELPQIAATPKAKAAFRARCVGQHLFPNRAAECLGWFAKALFTGAVAPKEVTLFVLRGLMPAGLKRRAFDAYFRMKAATSRREPSLGR